MSVKETIDRVKELFYESEEGQIVDVDHVIDGDCVCVFLIVIHNHMVYSFWYFKDSNDDIKLTDWRVLQ